MKSEEVKRVLIEYFPEGALLYEMKGFRFIETNRTGAEILRGLVQGESLSDIEKKLLRRYNLSLDKAREDVYQFCRFFEREGLISFF